jgi:hypothetical protein
MPNPGLFPFCLSQFCTPILPRYLLLIPKGSELSFRSSGHLIDLLLLISGSPPNSGLASLAIPSTGWMGFGSSSGQNRLNGFFGG